MPNSSLQNSTRVRTSAKTTAPEHRSLLKDKQLGAQLDGIQLDEQFRALLNNVDRLLRLIRTDPGMSRDSDLPVATILSYRMLETAGDVAAISHSEICKRSGLSVGAVRHSLRKLTAAGYFKVIRPSTIDPDIGGLPLKYQAQFEVGAPLEAGGRAAA
ncbi:winged helix-turn-helix domain-containing protein [Bradyrhizobium japonicum]|uniref:winged helix-turn-helix domain-containing protein n=1 Tax=Bradyrhizobium japonicum TaxID=375 RepID=UPI0012FD60F7|nr:winged helix-turn-helix domain-containing protein [Bradyrhizobium japonicum]